MSLPKEELASRIEKTTKLIEKYDLDKPFWTMAKAAFGYEDENPSLRNLLI